ncbi:class I SAM-dependent methyltransferase [Clostridium ihumii]|uniref:class I SAM-dependent methyltransferase n=1 Tax=Clostridium ihumii TaxID=1470356 RepID=UPI00058E4A99|nr:class I SAM-dependent methyltransferase [Clostridium ihumii]
MKFYDEISNYYKYIFPMSGVTLDFLKESFQNGNTILDVACGSGEYTIGLSKEGYKVNGIDLDEKMIEKAKEKSRTENELVEFKVGNILNLSKSYNNKFNGIFCIGNSLVHLDNKDEIEVSLNEMKNLLESNGVLVIQIINYYKVLNLNLDGLPTIKNEEKGLEFIRKYVRKDDKILFNTILKIENNNELSNSVELFPITYDDLIVSLERIGFKDIELFGGFNKNEFDKDKSMPLVIRCKKA